MVAKMTTEQIEAKKSELLTYSEQDLLWLPFKSDDKEKKSLYKLGIGLIDGISKMKKNEALEALKSLRTELKSIDAETVETAETVNTEVTETTDTEVIETAETVNTEITEIVETVTPKVDLGELISNEGLAEFCEYIHKEYIKICENNVTHKGDVKPEIHGDLSDLAGKLFHYIDSLENQDGNNISATTKMRYRTKAMKVINNLQERLLKNSKGGVFYNTYKSAIAIFEKRVTVHFDELSKRKKFTSAESSIARNQIADKLDVLPIYNYAISRLNDLAKMYSLEWCEVSIALATVTGRRLSEIHHTNTKFELITDKDIAVLKADLEKIPALKDYREKLQKDVTLTVSEMNEKIAYWIGENFTGGNFNAAFYQQYVKNSLNLSDDEFKEKFVKFVGQQKIGGKKGQKDEKDNLVEMYYSNFPYYFIPVMVSAKLVVNAHQWLVENNKVCDETDIYDARKMKGSNPRLVAKKDFDIGNKGMMPHKRYSGDLAKYMKFWRERIGISKTYKAARIEKEVFTYKSLRAIYANTFAKIFKADFETSAKNYYLLLAAILGHSRTDAMIGRELTDTKTPESYATDFTVVGYEKIWN